VIKNGNQASVLVLDDQNRVRVRNITLGLQGSTLVELKAGLTEGERVINGGQSKYQPGEEVKPRLEHLPTNDTNTEQSEERQQ
jgi:hypothetical protein